MQEKSTQEYSQSLDTILNQEMQNFLDNFAISYSDFNQYVTHKLKDELIFETDKYKFVTKIVTGDVLKILNKLNPHLKDLAKEVANILQTVNINSHNLQAKENIIALIQSGLSLVPIISGLLADEKMQEIFFAFIIKNKIIQKNENNELLVLSAEGKQGLTMDDLLLDDLSIYTRICIALTIIVIKGFFFKTTQKIIL
jgi:hypothetical protein